MSKRLYDIPKDCNGEEEVKSEFCKFFRMKINALKSIDHYAPTILKTVHEALRAKLLPKVYEYGFLNPGVEYFQ